MYEIAHKKELISLYQIYSVISKNSKPEEKKFGNKVSKEINDML